MTVEDPDQGPETEETGIATLIATDDEIEVGAESASEGGEDPVEGEVAEEEEEEGAKLEQVSESPVGI